jgi:protein SCO1/2
MFCSASTSRSGRRGVAAALVGGMLTLALAGCGNAKPVFKGADITGTHLGQYMAMMDRSGHERTLADYRGKVVAVYFGYTHCPDVCPTIMAKLANVMHLLKGDAKKVQVIMISVDPQRDTPAIVDTYVKAFYPTFVGLSGSAGQLAKTAKSFKVYYKKLPGKAPDSYAVDHSSRIYIIDRKGRARDLLDGTAPAGDIAHDIAQLL